MTAEIAILNKSAVALASDSAVTIAAGSKEEKIFFSADKLFELSHANPIGIMIYNGMHFMQAPLHMLITDFRASCRPVSKVEEAADAFLQYLSSWGVNAPAEVHDEALRSVVAPIIKLMNERLTSSFQELLQTGPHQDFPQKIQEAMEGVLSRFERIFDGLPSASFIGAVPRITKAREETLRKFAKGFGDDQHEDRVLELLKKAVLKQPLSDSKTGIVIAGYGRDEIFPTLVSYEIDGMLFGRLKFERTNFIDIDRRADRARVLPFAQKEMVERFLYGIDAEIEESISSWSESTISTIKDEILKSLSMTDADRSKLTIKAEKAEQAFLDELKETAFETIRNQSKSAIEGMVEFMPKPELATMAEALVNLTSIKRRVSRGMETVGGPIDVAIISKGEGFVWVKRKHYFTAELNPRYQTRVSGQLRRARGEVDAEPSVTRKASQKSRRTRRKVSDGPRVG